MLEDSTDDNHGMRPQDINDCVAAELPKMIRADHRIIMATPQIVHARFEFDDILDAGWISDRPIHPAYDAA